MGGKGGVDQCGVSVVIHEPAEPFQSPTPSTFWCNSMNFDNYVVGPAIIVLFVACSGMGVVLLRRIKDLHRMTKHHEVMGYFFPVAGSVYGVLLGLVVVNAITIFSNAQDTVLSETSNLISLYMIAEALPPADKSNIQTICRDYAQSVIGKEWEEMDNGRRDQGSHRQMLKLFAEIIELRRQKQDIASEMLNIVNDLWKARRERLDLSMHEIPTIEWVALCVGGVLMILFSYMFVMDSVFVQLIGTTLLATLIAINLFLVVMFASPFSGDLTVSNEPFRHALSVFSESGL